MLDTDHDQVRRHHAEDDAPVTGADAKIPRLQVVPWRWLRVIPLAPLVLGCGGSTAGGGPTDASFDANTVGAGVDDAGLGDAPFPSSGDACWCDPSNPVQSCCPAMVDAAACFLSASNYDTSCPADSDCVAGVGTFPSAYPVQFGNWCVSQCLCGGGAISKNSAAQYEQDVAKTPLGSGAVTPGECGCPVSFGPCCSHGQCVGSGCMPTLANDATDVDASPGNLNYTVLCVEDAGPTEAGSAVPGASRRCNGPEICTPFNGGWQCCTTNIGPISMCVAP